jgi:hypothetical protein
MGVIGAVLAAVLYFIIPTNVPVERQGGWINGTVKSFSVVFRNPQSILCGLIAGLLFIPTTILDMIWGVKFLQEAHKFEYGEAVLRSATVPVGWIIGCPLLGALSDRLGRRKPVIIAGAAVLFACVAWVLYGRPDSVPPYVVGLVMGLASGAAMIPYTVIKEENPRELGHATGVINFVTFALERRETSILPLPRKSRKMRNEPQPTGLGSQGLRCSIAAASSPPDGTVSPAAEKPPSTTSTCPVTKLASSEQRKTAAPATSSARA